MALRGVSDAGGRTPRSPMAFIAKLIIFAKNRLTRIFNCLRFAKHICENRSENGCYRIRAGLNGGPGLNGPA